MEPSSSARSYSSSYGSITFLLATGANRNSATQTSPSAAPSCSRGTCELLQHACRHEGRDGHDAFCVYGRAKYEWLLDVHVFSLSSLHSPSRYLPVWALLSALCAPSKSQYVQRYTASSRCATAKQQRARIIQVTEAKRAPDRKAKRKQRALRIVIIIDDDDNERDQCLVCLDDMHRPLSARDSKHYFCQICSDEAYSHALKANEHAV